MSIVDKILENDEGTPILIHSDESFAGENIFIFTRYGDEVKISKDREISYLVGSSLYGVRNQLDSEDKNFVKPKIYTGNSDLLLIPDSPDLNHFEIMIGSKDVREYLISIDRWVRNGCFNRRIDDQMACARTFGMNYVPTSHTISRKNSDVPLEYYSDSEADHAAAIRNQGR